MGSFLGITFVSNQNSTIFAASSLFPQSSILRLDHKQDILWGIPQGTTLQNWLWWGEECYACWWRTFCPLSPLVGGLDKCSGLSYLWFTFHWKGGPWDGWQFTLPVLQWMVDIITVLKTAPSFSAPHGRHPWAVFPKWGRPAILLVQSVTGWVWQACSPAVWTVREVTLQTQFLTCSLCHGLSMWIQYIRLGLGGGSMHVNFMPDSGSLIQLLSKFTLSIGSLSIHEKSDTFLSDYYPLSEFPHGQNPKEKER